MYLRPDKIWNFGTWQIIIRVYWQDWDIKFYFYPGDYEHRIFTYIGIGPLLIRKFKHKQKG